MSRIVGADRDMLVIRTDKDGNLIWHKHYGYRDYDIGIKIIQSSDEKYFIVGNSIVGNKNYQVSLVEIDNQGNELWKNNYGGSNAELANTVLKTTSGVLFIGGEVHNDDGIDSYLLKF